jgi:KipI family sensor histidine kinase inhibitor
MTANKSRNSSKKSNRISRHSAGCLCLIIDYAKGKGIFSDPVGKRTILIYQIISTLAKNAEPAVSEPKLYYEGTGSILLDVSDGAFDSRSQRRILEIADALLAVSGILETVPGMNNLMVVFDPLAIEGEELEARIVAAWQQAAGDVDDGPIREVPVVYGGEAGPDLSAFANAKGLSEAEVIARHSHAIYSVAAVGAMPGFVYLSGLDPSLAAPRLSNPRSAVPKGSVIVGGAQAGIMPVTAPSGWHILGRTSLELFDPERERPALFRPGDRIRFVAEKAP